MQLICPNLQSFQCSIIKKVTKPDGECLIFYILNDSSFNDNDSQKPVQQVIISLTQSIFIESLCDEQIARAVREDIELTLFVDANLSKQKLLNIPSADQVVALQLPHQGTLLLYPKALQVMPYPRLFKEAFLVAIPWLGLMISLFSVYFTVISTVKRNRNKQALSFTFSPTFHALSTLICCYPPILFYLSLNQFIPLAWLVSYFLLCAFNFLASKQRNTQVDTYNQAILDKTNKP